MSSMLLSRGALQRSTTVSRYGLSESIRDVFDIPGARGAGPVFGGRERAPDLTEMVE